MNIVEYKVSKNPIAFCMVDDSHTYQSSWTVELIKNIADFTITNVYSKGYDILQGQDEDVLLTHATDRGYKFAVVFSIGTDFINGNKFFDEIEKLSRSDLFLAGHVLDRKDAYYELHHQCYFINLKTYKKLGNPPIGKQELGAMHTQDIPWRSADNWHDDYTPKTISGGDMSKDYQHKCHGWNILKTAFDKDLTVLVFDENIRNNKKHYYPENQTEFLKHSQWAYLRHNYCNDEFVHTGNTEYGIFDRNDFEQVFVPASGLWWTGAISKTKPVKVVMYDYNQKALDYWKNVAPKINNVSYEFVKIDLLTQSYDFGHFDKSLPTIIILSNIFVYEGTTFLYSLEYRLAKENEILKIIEDKFKDYYISTSARAATGFVDAQLAGKLTPVNLKNLKKPTWHIKDWL